MSGTDSSRSSALISIPETPGTPSPSDSRSQRHSQVLDAPNPERMVRLPNSSLRSDNNLDTLQALIVSMQADLQVQRQQQRDFKARMESLLIGKGKAAQPAVADTLDGEPSTSQPSAITKESDTPSDADIGIAKPLEPPASEHRFPNPHHSQYVREPSYPHSYSHNLAYPRSSPQESHTKIKASDLPKFRGDKGEDVEVWIEQVSAIFEAIRCTKSEIVALLSVILKDNALKWFTRLGVKGRSQLPTWMHWQDALRQRFLKANYFAEKKRLWKKRDLRSNKDLAVYFDAKVDLQAYVFDESTPESELILDILDGLPDHTLPTLKSFITPDMDLLDFRRILLDYEKGLRWNGTWNSKRGDNNSGFHSRFGSNMQDRNRNTSTPKNHNRDAPRTPPRACSYGGMHWYSDCPKRTAKSNNVSSYRPTSLPNKIPVTRSKWPSSDNKSKTGDRVHPERQSNFVSAKIEEVDVNVIELSLPEQDNEGYDDLYASICTNVVTGDVVFQKRHSDKVPIFAMAKIGTKEGKAHEVCIDTGSAISLMDSQYLKKNFPSIKVNPSSTIMLKGVGSNQTHGWINADLHFVNDTKELSSITGAFHVVTSLSTKIIIGNDILIEEGAMIDLKASTCTFQTCKGTIPIIGKKNATPPTSQPYARLQQVFAIKPGFQSRVPITLTSTPPTSLYLLDPVRVSDDIKVARALSATNTSQHFAHVMNVGINIVKLPANTVLANIRAVNDISQLSFSSNNVTLDTADDLEAFEEALQEIDINVELTEEEKDRLRATIRSNRQAFS